MAILESTALDVNTPISDKILGGDPHEASAYFEDYLFRMITDLDAINGELNQLGLTIDADGETTLYYNGTMELVTKSGGIRIDDELEIDGALNHDGSAVGFYGATPVSQQTSVAVTAAAIHTALVNLGLITA